MRRIARESIRRRLTPTGSLTNVARRSNREFCSRNMRFDYRLPPFSKMLNKSRQRKVAVKETKESEALTAASVAAAACRPPIQGGNGWSDLR
jgi:hypothetical protein